MKRLLLFSLLITCGLTGPAWADSSVSFNEIMYHPATNEPVMEWVELRNLMAVDVDISGWSIHGGIDFSFASNTIVRGGGYLVVASSPATLKELTGLTNVVGPFSGRLNNNGDTLRLHNNSDRVVDEVSYGVDGDWPVAPDGSGVSLAKRNAESASGPAANWTSSHEIGGTPGAANFVTGSGVEIQALQFGQVWRVDGSGNDLGAAWRVLGYDDSAWIKRSSVTNRAIATLFNTGLSASGVALGSGAIDPHYVLVAAAQGPVPTNAIAMAANGAWLANDPASGWIGVINSGALNVNAGNYNFRTTFSLDGFLPSTAQLTLAAAADNSLPAVLLNGTDVGFSYVGFASLSPPFTVASGFVPGTNTVEFRTVNEGTGPNPGGFRATVSGTALARIVSPPLPAGATTYYFRAPFVFSGDPGHAQLRLNAIFADGAVVYLNGVEVYRVNLPGGAISAATPALSEVTAPSVSSSINLAIGSLQRGTNMLAVEVHQAVGSPDEPLAGVELFDTALPAPDLPLAFNEIAAATNGTFFVEVLNYGNAPQSLDGFVIVQDGVTNRSVVLGPGLSLAPGASVAVATPFGSAVAPGDRFYLETPARDQVLDGVVAKRTLRGRYPAGTGPWFFPTQATPGAPNVFAFHNEIVINEIMYNHKGIASSNGLPPKASSEAWIELLNRSSQNVDLTGWELAGGISYRFTPGQILAPGAYLVVAEDAPALRAAFPGATIVGNLGGQLSHNSDSIVLKDPSGNPADSVRYHDAAPWPPYANGGGSSLELRDPNADNSVPEAWADSNESGRSQWRTFSYRTTAAIPTGSGQPTQWSDFIFGLLGAGECLIDDLSVIESPATTGLQLVANGGFENGLTGWRSIGTHGRSRVEVDPDNPGNHVLHVIATGPQEHMHNHIETTLISNRVIVASREYQISYRARWLAGNNLLNTRLYFNRAGRTMALPYPALNGTPGAPNSRLESNLGPTFTGLSHAPVVPQPGQGVTVTVSVQDPQGVAAAEVWWSADGGAWSHAAMTDQGGGRYAGSIPGFNAGALVQFYVRAGDGLGASATYPAGGTNSGAVYAVADGQANLALGHNIRIVMSPSNRDLLHAFTNVMSNDEIPATVIYDEKRAYYNVGIRLKGSERGRYSDTRTSFHLDFPTDDPFRGVHPVMLIDRSGAGDSATDKQQEILIRHILLRAGNIPGTQPDMCRVIAPFSRHTGPSILSPRHEDEFIQTAFTDGGNGTMWELELIYFPTSTNQFGYKNPQPDSVVGTDIQNLTDDKEFYRYNFIIKNHRDADDYSRFITFAKTFSIPQAALLEAQTKVVMDMDEWTRTFALESLCGVNDSYTFGNNHNLFMYVRPSDQRFVAFSVDMDFSFNRGSGSSLIGDQNLGLIFNLPAHKRLFYGHAQDIIATSFNTSYMSYWVPHYLTFAPGQTFSTVLGYISSRITSVNSEINTAGGNSPFNTTTSTIVTNGNLITLSGTAPVSVRTILINGVEYPIIWSTVSGWTVRVPVTDPNTILTVQPYDLHGRPLTNLTRTVTVNYTGPAVDPAGAVVINEIMYNPVAPGASYVELLNVSTNTAFDLSGWRLNGLDFTFAPGSYITNRGLVVVAASRPSYLAAYGSTAPVPLGEFGGTLQNDGETLTLLRPGVLPGAEIVVDKVRYEGGAPWPSRPNGGGAALQLVDARQDHSRVGNWSDGSGWKFFSYTGGVGASGLTRLSLFMENTGGDVYLDDLALVAGSTPGVGQNVLANGDFEAANLDPWVVGPLATNSERSTTVVHAGQASLHFVVGSGAQSTTTFYQDFPSLDTNGTYTLSFWYLSGTSGTNLNFRLNSVYRPSVNPRPVLFTPGTPNSSVATLPPFPRLYLNEVQPENVGGITDNFGEHEPWIELYNAGATPISLDGYYLANGYATLDQWPFPAGATLQPGEFKVVFADGEAGETTAGFWHTSFRLAPAGGSVALVWTPPAGLQVLDYLNYTNILAGRSYGDYPDGQVFDRQEFYVPTPGAPNNNVAPSLAVRINEWMAANASSLLNTNHGNRYDDWFELYNPAGTPADLAGYFLTDDLLDKFKFEIPPGYVIPAHGYLLVWADNHPGGNGAYDPDLHVNFALNQQGDSLGLFASDGVPIDTISFAEQFTDYSAGRVPNGTGPAYILANATPRGPNSTWANRYPTLAPILDAQLVTGQSVSFAAMGADPDSPPQTLTYSLDEGAPLDAVIGASSGVFNWTASPTPGTNRITIRVTDNGTPPLSAAQSFQFIVVPGFRVSSLDRNPNGDVVINIGSTPGKTYRVEYSDDLSTSTWTPIVPDVVAGAGTLSVTNSVGGIPHRFYRVSQLD